ncbi:fasciclin-like arabinogalactan protein 10 [Punica granatum]|uniref:FAS1 domain-containing protein n=2 Tax=Punica granatum TaxID=22663 RepID=A0A218VXL1_PUNGR|nr:fasciclin-like arabinogalactan protein 10 [Punica granatum]OWM64958.1 hypothetical protein CDL15_Pgr028676 [Punica granatum]PKI67089.1 hypothetical protein CRG98_012510 [Punica granatum]
MASAHLVAVTFALLATAISAHNITDILDGFPEYSLFNSYLSQTKLADEINSRQTLTVLALDNAAMSALAGKKPLSVIKNELEIHVVLDYFDPQKLHQIPDGSTLSTTLYQTTGNAPGNIGFVNITVLQGGKVGFGPAAPGSKLDSTYTKSVKQIPYNISIIQISAPIVVPQIVNAPAPTASGSNITALLEKAGCKTFASLLISSGVIKTYESAIDKGLTVFAPNDEAFKAKGVPDLGKLTNAELVSLLQYHAVPSYTPIGSLKSSKDPISTLATNGAAKYDFTVKTAGDSVTLDTGVGSSRVASTIIDSTPFAIFAVDNVLLPTELFGNSPSSAPAPEPVSAPSPAPVASAPGPAVEASSPLAASPPAPPMDTPEGSPAGAPAAKSENSTSDNAAVHVKAPAMLAVLLLTVSATVISSLFLS